MGKKLKLILLGLGIFLVIGSLLFADTTNGERITCCCIGIFLILLATVNVFRWAVASLFFLGLALANMSLLIGEDGSFDFVALILFVLFLLSGIHFSSKTIKQFRQSRVSSLDIYQIDNMTGLEFEAFTANLLKKLGYTNVKTTKASGDQGIDVLASSGGTKYAIQCKHYSGKLDNTPVQEAFAGKVHYGCDIAVVITNSTFTAGAKELAQSTGVLLWDRNTLQEMLMRAQPSIAHAQATKDSCCSTPPPSHEADTIPTTATANRPCTIDRKESISTDKYIENFSKGINDELLPSAVDVILPVNLARISMLQRCLHIGYERSAKIMDEMVEKELIGPAFEPPYYPVLITPAQWEYIREQLDSCSVIQITEDQWDDMRNWYNNTDDPK